MVRGQRILSRKPCRFLLPLPCGVLPLMPESPASVSLSAAGERPPQQRERRNQGGGTKGGGAGQEAGQGGCGRSSPACDPCLWAWRLHRPLRGKRNVILNPPDVFTRQICRFAGCAGRGGPGGRGWPRWVPWRALGACACPRALEVEGELTDT